MSDNYATSLRSRRHRGIRPSTALLVLVLSGGMSEVLAQTRSDVPGYSATAISGEVMVTGTRSRDDEQMAREVTHALAEDPFVFGEHITVTVQHGVIKLEGVVDDVHELLRVLRLCRKASGSKRIVDELEINAQLPDSG
jgi:osmotically-inducible protein OsmY